MIHGKLIHPIHPDHVIELKHEDRPYRCDGCHQIGSGARYTCDEPYSSCNFHLHKDCASPKATITHPFYADRVFVFLDSAAHDSGRYCDACGLDITGYNYHCFDHGLDLHPSCATLDIRRNLGELRLKLKRELKSKCYKCEKKRLEGDRKSWAYVSSCGKCHLHVACVKDMLLENWEDEYLGHRKSEASEEMAIMKREPRLQIAIDKKRSSGSWGRFAKCKKIMKIALTFIMAAIVGDPTALVIGLFSSLIMHH